MAVKCRYTKCDEWKQCTDELLFYYWDTNDVSEINKAFKYLGKRVIKKMNLYFTITNN